MHSDPHPETAIQYVEHEDGTVELVPADHEAKVSALASQLLAASSAARGCDILLQVRGSRDLTRPYAEMLCRGAVATAFMSLLQTTPLLAREHGQRIGDYLFVAMQPLAQNYIPGSHDNR